MFPSWWATLRRSITSGFVLIALRLSLYSDSISCLSAIEMEYGDQSTFCSPVCRGVMPCAPSMMTIFLVKDLGTELNPINMVRLHFELCLTWESISTWCITDYLNRQTHKLHSILLEDCFLLKVSFSINRSHFIAQPDATAAGSEKIHASRTNWRSSNYELQLCSRETHCTEIRWSEYIMQVIYWGCICYDMRDCSIEFSTYSFLLTTPINAP